MAKEEKQEKQNKPQVPFELGFWKLITMSEKKMEAGSYSLTKKQKIVRELFSWVWTLVFAVVCALIITQFFIVNARVPSASMEDTIMTGDRLIANRLAYKFGSVKRFDIVVFKFPDKDPNVNPNVSKGDKEANTLFIKRVIGLPGEKVTIKDNEVYINDSTEPLKDEFIKEPMESPDMEFEVPEDCYFMMGDNRNNSHDSRYWQNHFVRKDEILGKAVFKYFPVNHMGIIKEEKE